MKDLSGQYWITYHAETEPAINKKFEIIDNKMQETLATVFLRDNPITKEIDVFIERDDMRFCEKIGKKERIKDEDLDTIMWLVVHA